MQATDAGNPTSNPPPSGKVRITDCRPTWPSTGRISQILVRGILVTIKGYKLQPHEPGSSPDVYFFAIVKVPQTLNRS